MSLVTYPHISLVTYPHMSLVTYPHTSLVTYPHMSHYRLLSKSCPVLQALERHFKFECAVGLNGLVWISAPSLIQTIIIKNCLEASEYMNQDTIREMVDQAALKY